MTTENVNWLWATFFLTLNWWSSILMTYTTNLIIIPVNSKPRHHQNGLTVVNQLASGIFSNLSTEPVMGSNWGIGWTSQHTTWHHDPNEFFNKAPPRFPQRVHCIPPIPRQYCTCACCEQRTLGWDPRLYRLWRQKSHFHFSRSDCQGPSDGEGYRKQGKWTTIWQSLQV